jgi:alkylation response protein AidB-like acyl-CoA dehydrogenase
MTTVASPTRPTWPADRDQRRAHALEAVEQIRPILEAGVEESQRQGYLLKSTVQALRDSGVLGIMTPEDLGGTELDPVAAFEVVEAIGRIDPSTAWTATILLEGAGQLATHMEPEQASRVFRERLPLKAGSLRPGRASPVAGGFSVSGRWDFASGVHHADYVSATFMIEGQDGPQRRMALIPRSEIVILDAWDVLGMKATGSTAFMVEDVFVPNEMVFDPQGTPRRADTPLAKLGMVPYVLQMHSGMILGAARRALDEITAAAPNKRRGSRINIGEPKSLADSSWFQRELGQLDAEVRAARALCLETNERVRRHVDTVVAVDLELHDAMQVASAHAGSTAARVITRAFRAAGAEAIAESHVLGRLLRDVNTVLAHGVLGEIGFELHGEYVLGLQDESNRRMV